MRKITGLILLMMLTLAQVWAQTDYDEEMRSYREEQHAEFLDPEITPLNKEQRRSFKGHDYYPVDPSYRVEARFEPTPKARPFMLATSTGTARLYRRLGILHFELNGEAHTLEAYVQASRFVPKTAKKYVFLPVIDDTTGETTYGAGRYLHYEGIPEGDTWVIDFNKLYNPYCAYNPSFECPKVPEPNHLPIAIEAGVKDYKGK